MELQPNDIVETQPPETRPALADRNKRVETEYFQTAAKLAKRALNDIGVDSPTSEQFIIARNLLLYKGELTKAQRKEVSCPDSTRDSLLSILRHSVRKLDSVSDTKTIHADCLILTHATSDGIPELHIYIPPYTDQETDAGKVARFSPLLPIEDLSQANRPAFLQSHGLKAHKMYDVHLHITRTTELVDKGIGEQAQAMLGFLPEDSNLHVTFDEIPFSRDQIQALQEQTSHLAAEMPQRQVAIEIKSNKLARIVEESTNKLPSDSYLRTLAKDHTDEIAQHIVDCLKDNGHPNLEEAQGFLFEALFALEVANPDSAICSRLDQSVNGNKRQEGRPFLELDLASPKIATLNREYVTFHSKAGLHRDSERPTISHGDYVFTVGGGQLGIIECKSSATSHIRESHITQLIATHDNAKRYISWHNTQSTGLRLTEDRIHLFIVKPRSFETDARVKLPTKLSDNVQVHTLNSSVEYGDLERVWRNIAQEYNIKS